MTQNKLIKITAVLLFGLLFLSLSGETLFATSKTMVDQVVNIKTLDYRMDIRIDYQNQVLSGDCLMTVSNENPEPLAKLPLLLYRLLEVSSITDERGNPLDYSSRVTIFSDWKQFQVNYVVVQLPQPLKKGERTSVRIKYSGHLLGYSETGMRYVQDSIDDTFTIIRPDCMAYPTVGYPSWKVNRMRGTQRFDYVVNVTVPDGMVVANGGELMNKVSQKGFTTYSYKNLKPAWRIDVAVAKYRMVKDETGKITVFCFPGHEKGAKEILDTMDKAIGLYSQWFGPLKEFKGFSVIEIPGGFGSQTDVSCILQTADAFEGKDQHYQFYHELSHLWNVGMRDPLPCRVESEGMAMFLQYLLQEKLEHKKDAVKDNFQRIKAKLVGQCQKNPLYRDTPIIDYGKKGMTGLSYSKGMLFFTLLHRLVGEETFFALIKSFYDAYPSGATTQEFIGHLNRFPGKDLTRFTHDWLETTQSSSDLLQGLTLEELVQKYR